MIARALAMLAALAVTAWFTPDAVRALYADTRNRESEPMTDNGGTPERPAELADRVARVAGGRGAVSELCGCGCGRDRDEVVREVARAGMLNLDQADAVVPYAKPEPE